MTYLDLNRALWDTMAPVHARSVGYAVQRYVDDPAYRSDVVRFDEPRLGDVTGLDGVHLQCHIGTDTLSVHRLGARMTGLDFSGASIAAARDLAARAGVPIDYVEADVYDAVDTLGAGRFDLVHVSVGALVWLPSVDRWAEQVHALLRPGGRLFVREGHPLLFSLADDSTDDSVRLDSPYYEQAEPNVYNDEGTYVEVAPGDESAIPAMTTHQWNHSLGQIVTAVAEAGLRLSGLTEHRSVPWNALPGAMHRDPEHPGLDEWCLRERPERLAASFTLTATKP